MKLIRPQALFSNTPGSQPTHVKRFYKKVEIIQHPQKHDTICKSTKINLNNCNLSDTYWAVALDGRVTKTLYKDDLLIPSKALAIALAEEWEMQGERVDLKTLKLN